VQTERKTRKLEDGTLSSQSERQALSSREAKQANG
jgi:hypothetical protein